MENSFRHLSDDEQIGYFICKRPQFATELPLARNEGKEYLCYPFYRQGPRVNTVSQPIKADFLCMQVTLEYGVYMVRFELRFIKARYAS